MNIKGLSTPISNIDKVSPKRQAKTFESHKDKDPNSDNQGHSQEKKIDFEEQEVQEALEFMREYPAIKDNHLQVKVETMNEVKMVIIRDLQGKVVRRMKVEELVASVRHLKANSPDKRGSVLNKSA